MAAALVGVKRTAVTQAWTPRRVNASCLYGALPCASTRAGGRGGGALRQARGRLPHAHAHVRLRRALLGQEQQQQPQQPQQRLVPRVFLGRLDSQKPLAPSHIKPQEL